MQIPSVLFLRPDGTFLVGEAAERRGAAEPDRLVREFKRRIGDGVPILVAGTPQSPQALQARLLRWVIDQVTQREGSAPDHITLTHPANWGAYKRDLFQQTITLADLAGAETCTEPEAAATLYAARNVMTDGACVAVYDLGGGTFDAAVLRKTQHGFDLLGRPEGIEHLGGIDFDEAVFHHVLASLGDARDDLPDDAALGTSLMRLRRDCVDAKEALSSDTETVVTVTLPGLSTSVRLVRDEFEAMVGPTIADTIGAMRRVMRSADVEPADLTAIVLTGGSSRIPLVTQQITEAFDRPLALDTHPKHDVALGAAIHGVPQAAMNAAAPVPTPAPPPAAPTSASPGPEPEPEPEPRPAEPPAGGPPPPPEPLPAGASPGPRSRPRLLGAPLLIAVCVALVIAVVIVVAKVLGGDGAPATNPSGSTGGTGSAGTTPPTTPPTTDATNPLTLEADGRLPDDTLLVTGKSSTGVSTIYAIPTDNPTDATVIVSGSGDAAPHQPVLTADRKRFLYLVSHGGAGAPFVQDFADGEATLFLHPEHACTTVFRPAFAVDGRLAGICHPNDNIKKGYRLFVFAATGMSARVLVTAGEPIGDPTWQGDNIIFLQSPKDTDQKPILSVPSDGSDKPTTVDPGPARRPDWCDGHGLLILHTASPDDDFGTATLKLGARTRSLDFGASVASVTWSPNCERIALVKPDTSGVERLYIADPFHPASLEEIPLPNGDAAHQPAWGSR